MTREYKISTLVDMIGLDEDQIDRICAELPAALKYAKNLKAVFDSAGGVDSDDDRATKILMPLTWFDDGATDITVTARCSDNQSIQFKVDNTK